MRMFPQVAEKPNMGLTSWHGSIVRKQDMIENEAKHREK